MSSDADDLDDDDEPTGLEDEPVDCYTNFFVIEIPNPEPGSPPLTYDGEVTSERPLSQAALERAALAQIAPWLATLAVSPKWRQRFGTQPTVTIVPTGSIFGC